MRNTFQLLPADMIASETNLFVEISNESVHFFYQNDQDKNITGLSAFNFEEGNESDTVTNKLSTILNNQELQNKFNKVFISYAFNESILTPGIYYNVEQNNDNLRLVYGDLHQCVVLTDYIEKKKLYNIYRVPVDIQQPLINRFAEATFTHQYTILIKQLQDAQDVLMVLFYAHKLVVTLQKEGRLQIVQAYKYVTKEDVLYHMLNVCNLFNAKNTPVQLCGIIEKNSALAQEIEKYFLKVTFPGLPQELSYTDEIKALPGHFFSHLFYFALCV